MRSRSRYAANLVGVVLSGTLLFEDARRAGLTRTTAEEARERRRYGLIVAAVFLISIPVAFYDAHLASYLWIALFIAPPAVHRIRRQPT